MKCPESLVCPITIKSGDFIVVKRSNILAIQGILLSLMPGVGANFAKSRDKMPVLIQQIKYGKHLE